MSTFPSSGTMRDLRTLMGLGSSVTDFSGFFGHVNMWSKCKPKGSGNEGITPYGFTDLGNISLHFDVAWTLNTIPDSQKTLRNFVGYDHDVRPFSPTLTVSGSGVYDGGGSGYSHMFTCSFNLYNSDSGRRVRLQDVVPSDCVFCVRCVPCSGGTSFTASCSSSISQGGSSITIDAVDKGMVGGQTYDIYPFLYNPNGTTAGGNVYYSLPYMSGGSIYINHYEEQQEENPCTSVQLTSYGSDLGSSVTLAPGGSLSIDAVILPADCTDNINWSLSNSSYATLSGSDTSKTLTVDSNAPNGTQIIITCSCGNYSDSVTVTVQAAVQPTVPEDVTITGKPLGNVTVGDTCSLGYTLSPAAGSAGYVNNYTVEWTRASGSSNVSVSSAGVVSATDAGTATIRATLKVGGSTVDYDQFEVTFVAAPVTVTSVTLAFDTLEVDVNGNENLPTATVHYSDGTFDYNVTWDESSSHLHIANGKVYGDSAGTDISVIAKANADTSKRAVLMVDVVAVTPAPYVQSIYLRPDTVSLTAGGATQQLTAYAHWTDGRADTVISVSDLTWDIQSGAAYASVSGAGVVTPSAEGTATVRATGKSGTAYSGLIARSTVSVAAAPSQDVAITAAAIHMGGAAVTSRIDLLQGDYVNLDAVATPPNATIYSYTWSASPRRLVTLEGSTSSRCKVTGSSSGTGDLTLTLKITDTLGNEMTSTVSIRVTDAAI